MLPDVQLSPWPDRALVLVDPSAELPTDELAAHATELARQLLPKVTGTLAASIRSISGPNFFGIYFPDRRAWYLERGTRPFTMRSLSGKTVPMWVDDPTGKERRANPKAKTRLTVDGRNQVLIFRRVGTKTQDRRTRYPGAPGRIARREAGHPFTTPGRVAGRIARGNVGVAWRNPGIQGRQNLQAALSFCAEEYWLDADRMFFVDSASFYSLMRSTGGVA